MIALIAIVWGLIGACFGMVVLGVLGPLLFGIRDMEGQAGIFGLLVGGPIGAICGALAAIAYARKTQAQPSRQRWGLLGGIALLVGLPLAVWLAEAWRHRDHLTTRPNTWDLGFQVRLPASLPTGADEKFEIELRSAKENPRCFLYDTPYGLTRQGEHLILSGRCPLFYATPKRTLVVRIADNRTLVFDVRVTARPESSTFSDWFPVDRVLDNATGQGGPPDPGKDYAIRYAAK